MSGLMFIGMVGPESHNKEELRFVEELSLEFASTYYLRGAGVKGLRPHQLMSIPSRLAGRGRGTGPLRQGSLFVVPFRRLAQGANVGLIRRQLENIMRRSPFEWILWIRFPSPELVHAIEQIPALRVVYEPIDLYSAAEDLSRGESAALIEAEARLLCRATVVTGGQRLAERFKSARGGSHWMPFGTDRKQPVAGSGLPQTKGRRLIVVGCFDWRVDEPLLVSLMTKHPQWQLYLAGPRVRPWGEGLEKLPNVGWLGRIPVCRVRAVIRDCDVALIPYRLTDWTRHCLPVKVFEYLAEGKPVVATPLPELELLGDVVSFAPASSFADSVRRAMDDDSQAARDLRRQAADRFTLQDRARRAVELIQGKELKAAAR